MTINFPPGFLSSLSEKTLKELNEKALKFEYEVIISHEYPRNNWIDIEHNLEHYITVAGDTVKVKRDTVKHMYDGKYIGSAVGFQMIECSMIPKEAKRMTELYAKEKELEQLKKSIESIKNAFK